VRETRRGGFRTSVKIPIDSVSLCFTISFRVISILLVLQGTSETERDDVFRKNNDARALTAPLNTVFAFAPPPFCTRDSDAYADCTCDTYTRVRTE
jgi:hypothetical protein